MKVLWLSHSPAGFSKGGSAYNGCGWISSLQAEVSSCTQLAIAFPDKTGKAEKGKFTWSRETVDGVTYYPVNDGFDRSRSDRVKMLFSGDSARVKDLVKTYVEIVNDYQPDVIEVFGTEHEYGLVASFVSQPVVIHLQGILNPYFETYLPAGLSWTKYFLKSGGVGKSFWRIYNYFKWKRACVRENEIFDAVSQYMGRTRWDMEYVRSINPKCGYHHVDEVLRPEFYGRGSERTGHDGRLKIVSTISEPPYKGMDLVLRAGKLLKEKYGNLLEWDVYGNVDPALFCSFTGISIEDAGVVMKGVATAGELADALSETTLYVHPSYIDNSPNSLCEAQLMGVPCVACRVGGVPSIIRDGDTGLLTGAGSAEEMSAAVSRLFEDKDLYMEISRKALRTASIRHDRKKIVEDLLAAYRSITGKS